MKRDYAAEKAARTKSTGYVMWALLFFILLFVGIMARMAIRGHRKVTPDMPTGDEAYQIAKVYIRPTVKSGDADFSKDFQFSKKADSVYVVKSSFQAGLTSVKEKTDFSITLKYNGGVPQDIDSWSEISMDMH